MVLPQPESFSLKTPPGSLPHLLDLPSVYQLGKVKMGAAIMEHNMAVPQKLKIKLPYDPAIPHLGMLSKELKTESRTDI